MVGAEELWLLAVAVIGIPGASDDWIISDVSLSGSHELDDDTRSRIRHQPIPVMSPS